ncbi:MAG: ABC transporter ATP-binding protein [Gemmatimonadales bacterium]|nr:MAG: ABC transporter ATP-binding protein [Gemmatimonadales bacterium]
MSTTRPVIQFEGVSKRYWPGPVEAVRDVSLGVNEGEIVTLLGPSGCGKTTTLRLMAGFEIPDGGSIHIGGREAAGPSAWIPPERRGVGMVFQDYALFPHLKVGENVMFGLDAIPRSQRRDRAKEVLRVLDLGPHFDRYPHELSGGQQQRVALARAIAPRPVMVLMDEPFSNLDAHLRDQVRDEVVGILRNAGMTSIFVSHDQRDALAISDRVIVMNRGKVEQVGSPREIYRHPESVFVATFVGRTNLLAGVVQNRDGCVLTDFGSFCRVDRLGMPDGSQVMVAVRPDGFVPSENGQLRGRVLATTFTGAQIEAEVAIPSALGGDRRLVVHLPPSAGLVPGDQVAFRLDPDYASVVRNSCQVMDRGAGASGMTSPVAEALASS